MMRINALACMINEMQQALFFLIYLENTLLVQKITINSIYLLIQFLKAQLAESRSKCELLEQSLRVIAQENLDLEAKKLRSNVKPSRAASPSKASAKMSTEDEIANDAGLNSSILGEDEDQLEEEFFDIGKYSSADILFLFSKIFKSSKIEIDSSILNILIKYLIKLF